MNIKDLHIEAVILVNGDYPTHTLPQAVLTTAPYIVCSDGSADTYIRRGFKPDAIIGDGDSISTAIKEDFKAIYHQISDQETNDQTKALQFLLEQGKRNIIIVGATGKREDHALGNISLLIDYMHTGANVKMLTDYGIFIPCQNTQKFSSYPGQQVSIFNFGATGLKGEGLEYPLRDFTNWWQGSLNQANKEEFTIHAQGDYLVFLNY